ncbi:hypothetical protein [Tepidibacter aestuarii]|uniref:hypothetical protein n=1 Tax=Tepidibacter aestuarii TaxID=2925782 RepID=UPI0020BE9827|nr:hypothetical protein [Tepidibacter aestuarii]CAH2213496.1 conserved protein of unknown function [Tepidibacter aestuarii]
MPGYIISLNLTRPIEYYVGLFNRIKSLGYWMSYVPCTWVVTSNLTTKQIYDILINYLYPEDNILIMRLQGDWYGRLPSYAYDWLHSQIG